MAGYSVPPARTQGNQNQKGQPSPEALASWHRLQVALKSYDAAAAVDALQEARGHDLRTAPGPYWLCCWRAADWFQRGYDRLQVQPPLGLAARVYHDLPGIIAHLRAVAAGETPPALPLDPFNTPVWLPNATPPQPRDQTRTTAPLDPDRALDTALWAHELYLASGSENRRWRRQREAVAT